MSVSQELYESARPLWDAQLEHPFVRGLAEGTLEEERFKRWVLQDYLYLKEFSRIFAWAAAKTERLDSRGWYASVLDLTLNTEMELHRTYAARFDITASELEEQDLWPTTRAYTDFLVRCAADGDMPTLLSALLPCAWGYHYVGTALAQEGRPPDQRYADWIDQYASQEFGDAAQWLREELDREASAVDTRQRHRLKETFLTSSRYEWMFWEMCWNGESWPI